eukprot:CAMPEP_0183440922 /NCGR_PEP_ID=MMETSP0370-20130417/83125_1 /TAXON_ID=268820 /ORGANISM="Peridinium aciculiferum, Strain PAER-2" /LENGTH=32 /DNA_ID= /DNA_START= /DNA_END= /DNA_ORIENTATION=
MAVACAVEAAGAAALEASRTAAAGFALHENLA